MQFMLNGALALIEESEHLRDDYESMKAMLHPDQRMIIEFRHNFLHLVLRIFEPILSIRKPSKCGNVVEIEANIRRLLSLHGTSSVIFNIWKRTLPHPIRNIFLGLHNLSCVTMVTDDEKELIGKLVQWALAENSKWDFQMTEKQLANLRKAIS